MPSRMASFGTPFSKVLDQNNKKNFNLLKDADPGIAEAEDARKRLGGLKEPP